VDSFKPEPDSKRTWVARAFMIITIVISLFLLRTRGGTAVAQRTM
jgi:hypothetical protein